MEKTDKVILILRPVNPCQGYCIKRLFLYSFVIWNGGNNTNSKHERIVVPGLLSCSIVDCSVSVALLRFPHLLLAASQNPSTLWMY
jgi:hypothetical protein